MSNANDNSTNPKIPHQARVEAGKRSAQKRGYESLSKAGKKGAEARTHASRVEGGKKAAATRGHESLSQAGRKGGENSRGKQRVRQDQPLELVETEKG